MKLSFDQTEKVLITLITELHTLNIIITLNNVPHAHTIQLLNGNYCELEFFCYMNCKTLIININ